MILKKYVFFMFKLVTYYIIYVINEVNHEKLIILFF